MNRDNLTKKGGEGKMNARMNQITSPSKLTFHAPRKFWQRSDLGFFSRPYTEQDIVRMKNAGAWFAPGQHEFQDNNAAAAAGMKEQKVKTPRVLNNNVEDGYKRLQELPKEQREYLLALLSQE